MWIVGSAFRPKISSAWQSNVAETRALRLRWRETVSVRLQTELFDPQRQPTKGNPMAMAEYSILAGKTYRTPDEEIREVKTIDGGEVTYRAIAAPHGPGMIARSADKTVAVGQFAAEVENELVI